LATLDLEGLEILVSSELSVFTDYEEELNCSSFVSIKATVVLSVSQYLMGCL
jgi:hypothetical protein